MKPLLLVGIVFLAIMFVSCSPDYKAVAELDITAKAIDFSGSSSCSKKVVLEFEIGGQTLLANLNDINFAQFSYMKAHKDNLEFHVKLKFMEGHPGCCNGAHMTFYLLGKEVQTVSDIMEDEVFKMIAHKLPLKVLVGSQPIRSDSKLIKIGE